MKLKNIFTKLMIMAVIIMPVLVNAQTVDDVVSSKRIDIKSVPITNEDEYYRVDELVYEMFGNYGITNCNDDYTKCDFKDYDNDSILAAGVTMNYIYDPAVKSVVDSLLNKIPSEGIKFELTDIETISYLLNIRNTDYINIGTYSKELKNYIGYKNFSIEPMTGGFDDFFEYQDGFADIDYQGTKYGFTDRIEVYAKYAVYVDDNAEDVVEAAKTKLSRYFSVSDVVDTGKSFESFLEGKREEFGAIYDENTNHFTQMGITREQFINSSIDSMYILDDAPGKFINEAEPNIYRIEFSDGYSIEVAIVKDSSKANADVSLKTTDALLDVTVNSNNFLTPDTLIEVSKLTSGAEYNRIVALLGTTNHELFDIKLHSNSISNYISNGTFEVRLPISDNLKGKDLIVYYVKDDNSLEEHEVTVDGNYAVFTTNHFSIYTLAEKKTEANSNPSNASDTAQASESKEQTNASISNVKNPKTNDNIASFVSLFGISFIGFTLARCTKKRFN